jgi:hypothetical protein
MKHIRIISPAGVIEPNYVTKAKDRLESWGFHVSLGTHVFDQYGRFAGTVEKRLEDINAAFADATVDIILCSRGGYGLQQIVDKIVLPTRPKEKWPLVVGFSDVTILHALMSVNGVPSLHASMCKALASLADEDDALVRLRKALDTGKMWKNTVDLFRSLDIPVRTLECCSGDLADLKVKSCDVEAWSPRQKKYFEVGSCSNLGDAQARRLGIRVKGKDGKYFAHTLNNTVVAPPRMLIAFLENNLQEDGSIRIPEVLRPYMGGKKEIR